MFLAWLRDPASLEEARKDEQTPIRITASASLT